MNEQTVIKQFAEQTKMQFDIHSLTIYRGAKKIYGAAISDTALEQYLALTCTTIFKETDASHFVSHIHIGTDLYIVILESRTPTAFDGLDAQYIIHEMKNLKRKLGDIA